ncbi:MAG: CPBP family glutamic-type intramembrane protease [Candidatus Liptonbacteria bacterium]|nr:CPBP family glutamic-type intramembrane protease [Candidatus Liptonbacteria bacterium]
MRKVTALGEMLAVFALAMIQIWITGPQNKTPEIIALIIVVSSWLIRREDLTSLGLLAPRESRRRMLTLALFCLFLMIVAARMALEGKIVPLLGSKGVVMGLIAYLPWALFQQLVFNGYFAKRISFVIKDKISAAIVAGMIFSVIHIPNPLLMLVTLIGGVASSLIFLRTEEKNLYWLAAAQALIGVAIFTLVPASLHHNLRVGPGFFKWPH